MAVGDKRPVLMEADKGVPRGVAGLDESGLIVGAVPIVDGYDDDMDSVLSSGAVCFHQFGGNTKGTPKAYGKTNHGAGMILTYSGGGYGAQVAFCAGAYPFVRVIDNGKIGAWQQMLNTENMKVEYIKNINPVTTGCASLLEYLAKRYDEHPVIFGSVTDFSDLPSGVTLGQAQINLCGGLLTVTINALDGVWYRATNSLSAWTGSWKKATMT